MFSQTSPKPKRDVPTFIRGGSKGESSKKQPAFQSMAGLQSSPRQMSGLQSSPRQMTDPKSFHKQMSAINSMSGFQSSRQQMSPFNSMTRLPIEFSQLSVSQQNQLVPGELPFQKVSG